MFIAIFSTVVKLFINNEQLFINKVYVELKSLFSANILYEQYEYVIKVWT